MHVKNIKPTRKKELPSSRVARIVLEKRNLKKRKQIYTKTKDTVKLQ